MKASLLTAQADVAHTDSGDIGVLPKGYVWGPRRCVPLSLVQEGPGIPPLAPISSCNVD